MRYKRFLRSEYWKHVRELCFELNGKICGVCRVTSRLQVHHTTYDHRGSEHRHMEDLVVLCESCHKEEHNIKPRRPKKVRPIKPNREKVREERFNELTSSIMTPPNLFTSYIEAMAMLVIIAKTDKRHAARNLPLKQKKLFQSLTEVEE